MHVSNIAFYAMLFFLVGVGLYSVVSSIAFIVLLLLLCVGIVAFVRFFVVEEAKSPFLAGFFIALFFIASLSGSVYFAVYDGIIQEKFTVPLEKEIEFRAVVVEYPEQRADSVQAVVRVSDSQSGALLLKARKFPSIKYGDEMIIRGNVRAPQPEGYANYLKKRRIFGVVYYPEIEKISSGNGSWFKGVLFSIRDSFRSRIIRILPSQEAAFMSGLLLGERANFSEEFKKAMQLSGTTHLVALSGYNISIIAASVSALLLFLGLGKKSSFWCAVLVIVGFVIMTGGQASVVRAAIMGVILLLAGYVGKVHNIRNAIMLAAVLMVLINPYVLQYDVGFQLSFLALLGIVYLLPAIANALGVEYKGSFLSWKEHGLTTLSAQLFVIPVIFYHFDAFSLISFPSNILVLEAIPLTMFFGFLSGIVGYMWQLGSRILGLVALVLLKYETFIIEITAKMGFSIEWEKTPIFFIVVYYAALGLFIRKYYTLSRE